MPRSAWACFRASVGKCRKRRDRQWHSALEPGGVVAIEARNQLFALFTLNRYSFDLFCAELVRAPELRERVADRATVDATIEQMKERFRMDLPPIRGGKAGEPVTSGPFPDTQSLHPAQESGRGGLPRRRGPFLSLSLPAADVRRRHVGGVSQAERRDGESRDWRGHFMASAFIVTGVRR